MRILVCGSEGRIMSAAIPVLLADGHEVLGVDTCEKWGVSAKTRDYRFVQGDCSDPALLKPLMRGVDGVIQAAATLFGVVGFHSRAADILDCDLAVHRHVLRTAIAAGVSRVVYISSSMVYEQCASMPHREQDADTAPLPRTDYGLSKIVGERLSLAYFRQYALPYTIWRPFNALDPAERGRDVPGLSHVYADMAYRIIDLQQNPLEILGSGDQVRTFTHIREIGEVIARFSFAGRTRNAVYNLGRNEPITMKDLARRMYAKACARGLIRSPRPLEFRSLPVPATDVQRRIGSFEKLKAELAWEATITLDEAIDEMLDCRAKISRQAANCQTAGEASRA